MIATPNEHARALKFLRRIRPACGATAAVAAAFCAVVTMGLVLNVSRTLSDPQADDGFQALKTRLVEDAANTKLKETIRAEDLRLRQEFFQRRSITRRGAYLLAGGAAALAISLGVFLLAPHGAEWPPRPARPASPLESGELAGRLAGAARLGVLALVLLTVGAAAGWAVFGKVADMPRLSARAPDLPATNPSAIHPTGSNPAPMPGRTIEGLDEIRKNWPRFRGPLGAGVSEGPAPIRWDANSGQGVLWKTELPLGGQSSPIVWGGRVVVTAADKNTRKVLCFDANGGGLLWQRDVKAPDTPAKPVETSEGEGAGYAAPTPATDGNGICAVFANGDIACFDFDGHERWSRNLHLEENSYGYASSLDLVDGMVIVQIDQGGTEEGKSRLLALDAGTGGKVWEANRPGGGSWSSPIVVEIGGRAAVLASGNPYFIAHDLEDGSEIWRAKVGGGDGAPSPILAGGLALAVWSGTELAAVRADGAGDVTDSGVAWKTDQDVPDITSPVSDGRLMWTVTTRGVLNCYRVSDGNKVGSKDVDMTFQASPSLAGGKLYLTGAGGMMLILEATPEAREVARCPIGEPVVTCPAFVGGRIYIRGERHLICIGGVPSQ